MAGDMILQREIPRIRAAEFEAYPATRKAEKVAEASAEEADETATSQRTRRHNRVMVGR
jgi:hypothetical protein